MLITCCYPLGPFSMTKCRGTEDSANPEYPCPARILFPGTCTPVPIPTCNKLLALHQSSVSLFHISYKTFSLWCPHHQALLQLDFCVPGAVHSLMQTIINLWWLVNDQCLYCFLPSSKPVRSTHLNKVKKMYCFTFPYY